MEKKHLSSKADPGLVKTKEQVRHLYYRTWAKISKYIHHKEGKYQVCHLYCRTWAKISKYIHHKEGKYQVCHLYTGLSLTLVYSSTNMSKSVWMSGFWKPLVHKNMSNFWNNIFHKFSLMWKYLTGVKTLTEKEKKDQTEKQHKDYLTSYESQKRKRGVLPCWKIDRTGLG